MKFDPITEWVIETTIKGWSGWRKLNNCTFDNAQDAMETAEEIANIKPYHDVRVVKEVTEREVVG